MKPAKFLKAIRRELAAHPKKAALLGLLVLAAAYFWGPIVWRQFAGKPARQTNATLAAASFAPAPQGVASESERSNAPLPRWDEIRKWREQDPLMRTVPFDPAWPEPFRGDPAALAAAAANSAASAGATSPLASPAEVGLVLESVIYGPTNRAAVIGGKIYREGAKVIARPATGPAVEFELRRIDRRSVELVRHDKPYRLEFPMPKLGDSERIDSSPREDRPAPPTDAP